MGNFKATNFVRRERPPSKSHLIRHSLHGLDYFAAEGAKAFEDHMAIVGKHGERQWVHRCLQALKEGRQYFKTDHEVSNTILHVLHKSFKEGEELTSLGPNVGSFYLSFTLPTKRSNY